MNKQKNNMVRIGKVLKNNNFIKAKFSKKIGFNFLQLVERWEEIVGNKLAAHTVPLKHINRKLTVIANHSVFSHQLKFLEKPIIQKIYTTFPDLQGKITNLIFLNDDKKFHIQKNNQFHKKIAKKTTKQINMFNPKNIQLKKIGQQKFAEIKDEKIRDLLINIFIQSQANHSK